MWALIWFQLLSSALLHTPAASCWTHVVLPPRPAPPHLLDLFMRSSSSPRKVAQEVAWQHTYTHGHHMSQRKTQKARGAGEEEVGWCTTHGAQEVAWQHTYIHTKHHMGPRQPSMLLLLQHVIPYFMASPRSNQDPVRRST
jgi:hypothetical protein